MLAGPPCSRLSANSGDSLLLLRNGVEDFCCCTANYYDCDILRCLHNVILEATQFNHGWLHTDKAVQFEGVWPICALLVQMAVVTAQCTVIYCNAILIICSVEVGAGPKFWVPASGTYFVYTLDSFFFKTIVARTCVKIISD